MASSDEHKEKRLPPPYGPTQGMLQGLQLLQRTTPAKVDGTLLQEHKIAPGNEYKVIGALRFLEIIDAEGRPTWKSQLLKTRGPTFSLALQDVIRSAYADLFSKITFESATWEQIYNYFVTELRLGSEMSSKATRFFIGLCQLAEMQLAPGLSATARSASVKKTEKAARSRTQRRRHVVSTASSTQDTPVARLPLPIVLAITPETAEMDEEQFVALFRKMKRAFDRAFNKD